MNMSKLQKRIIYFGTNGCVGHYPLGINFTLSKEEYNDFGESGIVTLRMLQKPSKVAKSLSH